MSSIEPETKKSGINFASGLPASDPMTVLPAAIESPSIVEATAMASIVPDIFCEPENTVLASSTTVPAS